jgi:hypothetical protein
MHACRPLLASLCAAIALLLCAAPAAAASKKPKPIERPECDCDQLAQIELEYAEQEYLQKLFTQWAAYTPAALLTTQDMRDRADLLFNLTFYGAPVEAPGAAGSGSGAAFGTLYNKPDCPLVRYVYDRKGRKVMIESPESIEEHRNPPEYIQLTRPVTEDTYPSKQCRALVHYGFVHELHHQKTCEDNRDAGQQALWSRLDYFAKQDAAAYAAGLKVLREERARLRKKCTKQPRDGRWRGTIRYSYIFTDVGSETVARGQDRVYINGTGVKHWGTHKSVRASAAIDAPAAGGNIDVNYKGSRQESSFSKGNFVMPSECGSKRQVTWKLNGGYERRTEGRTSGTARAVLQSDGHSLSVSFRVPDMPDGTFASHYWDKPSGYCQPKNNRQIDDTTSETQKVPGFSVAMRVDIDPDRPDDIEVIRIEPSDDGKGQHYYSLKLHRSSAER